MPNRPHQPHGAAMSTGAFLGLLKGAPARSVPGAQSQRTTPREWTTNGGRVLLFPAAKGVVRVVGLGPGDEWVAEYCCREEDFDEKIVRRMQRRVAEIAGRQLKVVE